LNGGVLHEPPEVTVNTPLLRVAQLGDGE
jgi:hypothetical protein